MKVNKITRTAQTSARQIRSSLDQADLVRLGSPDQEDAVQIGSPDPDGFQNLMRNCPKIHQFFQRYDPNCGKMPYFCSVKEYFKNFPDADLFQNLVVSRLSKDTYFVRFFTMMR